MGDANNNVIEVTDDTFEKEIINSSLPVLVDFWAEWCGPCQIFAPILSEIATDYAGKIKVAKINIDQAAQVTQKYGIRGIPTLILFKDGKATLTKVGALTKSSIGVANKILVLTV